MLTIADFPFFIGWAGIILKVIPFIFVTINATMLFALQYNPEVKLALMQQFVSTEMGNNSYHMKLMDGYLADSSLVTLLITVVLLIMLSVDISLIRGSNARSYKTLIPGMVLYILLTINFVIALFQGSPELRRMFFFTVLLFLSIFFGLAMTFCTFKTENQSTKLSKKKVVNFVKVQKV